MPFDRSQLSIVWPAGVEHLTIGFPNAVSWYMTMPTENAVYAVASNNAELEEDRGIFITSVDTTNDNVYLAKVKSIAANEVPLFVQLPFSSMKPPFQEISASRATSNSNYDESVAICASGSRWDGSTVDILFLQLLKDVLIKSSVQHYTISDNYLCAAIVSVPDSE